MRILDTNNKFILASNQSQLFLIDAIKLQLLHTKEYQQKTDIKVASLQYGTGVAAICIGSKVHFYDFFYHRQIDLLQTYKPILNVCLRKNILIIISQDRILVHNVEKKENESYIQTINGKLSFLDENYQRLSIFYPEDQAILASKPVWSRKGWKCTSGVKYEKGCYFDGASKIVLSLFNTLSFYEEGQLMKIYGFDQKIIAVKSVENPKIVLVLLENNEIIGQNLIEQFEYVFEEVKQNALLRIQANEENKEKPYTSFWICDGYIYHWIKPQNSTGKLFRANINEPIKHKEVGKLSIEQKAQNQIEQNNNENDKNQ